MASDMLFMAEVRERKGLRQLDLARKVGVTESMVSRIETGRAIPNLQLAQVIERELGYPIAGLLKPYKNPQKTIFDFVSDRQATSEPSHGSEG